MKILYHKSLFPVPMFLEPRYYLWKSRVYITGIKKPGK
jgi:hypothetical protein